MERQHRDYMVGWICATSNELVTARAMLDEEHTSLPYNARDSNAYTLGRIAGHNVVVASLPPGYYGSTAAAVVVRDMLWSFPAIKFGLLVGIGGGFCSPTQDVRLGDVVVSVPSSTSPGVIQFDHGKLLSQGIFQRSGSLNKPPSTLLMAISRLQAEHEINGPEFGLYILEALRGNPSERRRFSSPGHDQDLLFTAAYTHPPAERDCSLCDRSQLILRPQRDSQTPEVHYGSIASGNMVIKDAITRDNISRELGVLCFEMEAAGIMDNFPCLVIRGIADYSDSHKNAKWQGYAALAAAAYAKELLSIVPGDVKTDIAAAEVLDPEYLGSFEGRRADLDPDTSDTISEASTLMGSLEPGVVDTAIKKVAEVLAADENVRVLCTAAVLRITPSMLQWNLVAALTVLSKTLKKLAQTPVERGMGWLLSRYKPLIATSITETICRQEHIAVSLGLSQEETLSILDGRLMEMLRDRFPTAQAPYPASNIGRAREENTTSNPEEVPTQDLENGLDPDTQEPPESAILDDLGQLDQILCKGPVFEGMYERLKMLLFPSVPQLIENVLSRHLTITTQASTVICVIKWELLQYVKYENLDVHDIEFVFTLNSEFDCACAIPLGDYMSAMWEKGKELLEAVKASVSAAFNNVFDAVQTKSRTGDGSASRTQIQLVPALAHHEQEHALVHISGSFDYISKTLEQLAWLAATLRLHHEDQLTVSYVDFRAQRMQVGQTTEANFRLCLWSQDKLPQPTSHRSGQCWTSLFTESVLAYGFSLPRSERPDGMIGLELPFNIMAAFAGVKFPVLLGERLVFASDISVLIPEVISGDSVLWHFDTIDNILRQATAANKISDPRLDNLDASKLRRSRAFLGYNKSSEIIIGTADFDEVGIAACQVPRTGAAITLNYEGPLGLSLGAKGYATANAGTTWRFNRGESAQMKGSELKLDDLFKRSAESPALLYDDQKCIAFLIPELSIVLQMAATYLRKDSLLTKSKIPRAKRSFKGGAAAYEAVKAAKDLMVPLGTGPPVKYTDVVKDFILILEQRKTQKTIRRRFGEISLKKGLRGWDYTDVQKKKFEFWERELPTSVLKSRPVWWKLFKKSNAVTLFFRGMTYPISGRSDQNSPSCISWVVIPEGQHFLLANVQELESLKAELCQVGAKYPIRFMPTNKLAWARPVHSILFEENCTPGDFCNPLQTMRKVTAMRERKTLWHQEPDFHQNPGNLEPEGSVLFSDDPSAFGVIQCRFSRSGSTAPQMNWNIIFGSLCIAFFAFILSTALQPMSEFQFLMRSKVFIRGARLYIGF